MAKNVTYEVQAHSRQMGQRLWASRKNVTPFERKGKTPLDGSWNGVPIGQWRSFRSPSRGPVSGSQHILPAHAMWPWTCSPRHFRTGTTAELFPTILLPGGRCKDEPSSIGVGVYLSRLMAYVLPPRDYCVFSASSARFPRSRVNFEPSECLYSSKTFSTNSESLSPKKYHITSQKPIR
jgi:hypothetical protein